MPRWRSFTNPTGTDDARDGGGNTIGFYVNDEWRPVPNLAINLGLRYDAEPTRQQRLHVRGRATPGSRR
jgi:outer membrane receptor protein involved in Fe transport